ncbi:QRFP-like peptide receptor [Glandiceps talaboti]
MAASDPLEEHFRTLNLSESQVADLRENCSLIYTTEMCVRIQHALELIYGPCRHLPKGSFPHFSTVFTAVIVFLYLLVFVLSVFGNIAVITIMLKFRRMRTITNMYLVSLAVSDLMITFFSLPFDALYSVTTNWPFGEDMCKITRFVQTLSVSTSVLTLTAIAADRYIAIIYPLKAKYIHTSRRAVTILSGIWLVSVAMMSPQIFVLTTRKVCDSTTLDIYTTCVEVWRTNTQIPGASSETFITVGTQIYSIYLLTVLWVLPLALMVSSYGRIGHRLWTRKQIGDTIIINADHSIKQKKKLIKMLVVILALFAVCWGPLFLWNVVKDFTYNFQYLSSRRADWTYQVFATIRLIAYSNSCFNPIVYHKMSETFKTYLKKIMNATCKCCRGGEVVAGTTNQNLHILDTDQSGSAIKDVSDQ